MTLDDAFLQSINGLKNEDIFPKILGRAVDPAELKQLEDEKEGHYRDLYRPRLALVIEGLEWQKRFDTVVASEGLRGKPARRTSSSRPRKSSASYRTSASSSRTR